MVKDFEWYPAEDKKRAVRQKQAKKPKLRKSLEPGKVVILLSGRFRGKRVVFLKQLDSGLLLVTGPHKYNGVPLKRVNQVYTMTTSTKLKTDGVDVKKITDATFTEKRSRSSKGRDFFSSDAPKKEVSKERAALQKSVDGALVKANNKAAKGEEGLLKTYLRARFSITKNDKVHAMKF